MTRKNRKIFEKIRDVPKAPGGWRQMFGVGKENAKNKRCGIILSFLDIFRKG